MYPERKVDVYFRDWETKQRVWVHSNGQVRIHPAPKLDWFLTISAHDYHDKPEDVHKLLSAHCRMQPFKVNPWHQYVIQGVFDVSNDIDFALSAQKEFKVVGQYVPNIDC